MSRREYVVYADDIDGTEPATRVTFGLEGQVYEIDVSDENLEKLRDALAPFIEHSRKPSRTVKKSQPAELKAVREWARTAGLTVNPRGRIPKGVLDAYQAAHQ